MTAVEYPYLAVEMQKLFRPLSYKNFTPFIIANTIQVRKELRYVLDCPQGAPGSAGQTGGSCGIDGVSGAVDGRRWR